jgi:hypothetical protein
MNRIVQMLLALLILAVLLPAIVLFIVAVLMFLIVSALWAAHQQIGRDRAQAKRQVML